MTERAADAVRATIRERGPITFAEFMELALYGPGGFYERPPIGPGGDFVTSPHVHPVFGELMGRALRELHGHLEEPTPFRVCEVGAGDGTLARQLLGTISDLGVAYLAVESSAGARRALAAIDGVQVAPALPDDADPHVVIAHELLDNLPFRRIRGGHEIRVGLAGHRLVEVETPWDGEPGLPDTEMIVPVGAFAFVDRLASVLRHGYALLIDYGGVGAAGGGAHGYREHHVVEDLLADPGSTDLTAGVDLGAIADRARAAGFATFPVASQHDVLRALGFEEWTVAERGRQTGLLEAGAGVEAVRAWGGRSRASLLVDPAALGRLLWLVVASPGLAPPSWLP